MTEVSGWDPGHIHCGSGSLTPSTLGVVARRLAFNAFVRRAVGQRSRLSLVPRDGLERGGDGSPLEGRSATLERGGGVLHDRGSREGPSSEAENELPARGYIRYPRARRRLVTCSRVVPLPSSEAEIAQRTREGPSNEAEIVPRVRGECEWAARWASLSPFFSSGWEAGRGPSWAQSP